jgi:FMN phosphatase YigB (HAD superfamily)
LEALLSVSEEMARVRVYDHLELPSRERFRRALERVGCEDEVIAEAAVHLSRTHMGLIAQATVFPPEHAALLEALRPRYRLGVVSNFDDTTTAYDILVRHGIAPLLDAVVISEALGLRKPHPAVVRTAVRTLGLEAAAVLWWATPRRGRRRRLRGGRRRCGSTRLAGAPDGARSGRAGRCARCPS